MAANTAVWKTADTVDINQGRLQLVYAAHQQLEDELTLLRSYIAAAKRHEATAHTSHEGFSPWTGVGELTQKCVDSGARCLRLFNPQRKGISNKGLSTVATLYNSGGAAPHERVRLFLAQLETTFEGLLPVDMVLSGGRCLKRLDTAAADEYLFAVIKSWMVLDETDADDAFLVRFRRLSFWGDTKDRFRAQTQAVLALQIQCAAQCGHQAHMLAAHNTAKSDGIIPREARDGLLPYEALCWQEAASQREQKKATASRLLMGAPAVSDAPPSSSTLSRENQEVPSNGQRHGVSTGLSFLYRTNWKWNALHVSILLLLALLLRFASGPVARMLRNALRASRSIPARQRTLTL